MMQPGCALGEVGHYFCKHLKPDKKAMQRILMELVSSLKHLIKQYFLLVDITLKQSLGHVALVWEMVEEAATGDSNRGDDFLYRRRGESFGKKGLFRHLEDALALAACNSKSLKSYSLYRECS